MLLFKNGNFVTIILEISKEQIVKKPEQLENVLYKIKECIEEGKYMLVSHALDRQKERSINLPTTLYVLKNGYHEKRKTSFDNEYNTWKYAIRGKSPDNLDIRVIVTFDNSDMLIITVMHVTRRIV